MEGLAGDILLVLILIFCLASALFNYLSLRHRPELPERAYVKFKIVFSLVVFVVQAMILYDCCIDDFLSLEAWIRLGRPVLLVFSCLMMCDGILRRYR